MNYEIKIEFMAEGVRGCSWVTRSGNRVYAEIIRLNSKTITCRVVKCDPHDAYQYRPGKEFRVAYQLCRAEKDMPQKEQATYPVGLTITAVRWSTSADLKEVGFEPTGSYGDAPQTLVMSDGSLIIPSQDPEGNGPGFLFTTNGTGYVEPKREEQTCRT
jgi:hypothetical protein